MPMHPYKVVAPFLDGFLRTEALAAAFELGIIRTLEVDGVGVTTAALATRLSVDPFHLQILLDLLCHDGVLHKGPDGVSLADGFRKALVYRDLLEVRLESSLEQQPLITVRFLAVSVAAHEHQPAGKHRLRSQCSRKSFRVALAAARMATRRRAMTATASGIASTTASMCAQNSDSPLVERSSARNG